MLRTPSADSPGKSESATSKPITATLRAPRASRLEKNRPSFMSDRTMRPISSVVPKMTMLFTR
jgi:hypothetical protein